MISVVLEDGGAGRGKRGRPTARLVSSLSPPHWTDEPHPAPAALCTASHKTRQAMSCRPSLMSWRGRLTEPGLPARHGPGDRGVLGYTVRYLHSSSFRPDCTHPSHCVRTSGKGKRHVPDFEGPTAREARCAARSRREGGSPSAQQLFLCDSRHAQRARMTLRCTAGAMTLRTATFLASKYTRCWRETSALQSTPANLRGANPSS